MAGMIWDEFGRQVTIKHCRRLGKEVRGHIRNLLVSLSSADDAAFLINNARMLRQSKSDFVRSNIYINADLTPAESLAAYEARCSRRLRRAETNTKKTQNTNLESMETVVSSAQQVSGSAALAATAAIKATTASSQLDPTSPSFTPSVVHAEVHRSAE